MSSCNIIFGSKLLNSIITKIFTMLISHAVSTVDFDKSVIVPIPKNRSKSLRGSNNYRGIVLNTISKLFEYVLLESMLPKIQKNNYHFGFKSKLFKTLCSFMLSQTIQCYNKLGSNAYGLFLDASNMTNY